jgi:hypothetical protein
VPITLVLLLMFQAGPVNSPSSGCSQNAQTRKPAISASEFARETLVKGFSWESEAGTAHLIPEVGI